MNKRVGIIQVDGKLPNFALMQISRYHINNQDSVEWYKGGLFLEEYDVIYASKIFSFSDDSFVPDRAIKGGTGYDFSNRLPVEIAQCHPSYHLYPDFTAHIGFLSRGCRMNCKFCCVPLKEGRPYRVSEVDGLLLNPKGGKRLLLLDNDFFGDGQGIDHLTRINELGLKVCFTQGINIRTLTDPQAELLAQTKFMNTSFKDRLVSFAFDRIRDAKAVIRGIELCIKHGIKPYSMQFFILVGFDSTPEEDMQRIEIVKNYGAKPFVMPYDRTDPYQQSLARWANRRIHNVCSFNEYKKGVVGAVKSNTTQSFFNL